MNRHRTTARGSLLLLLILGLAGPAAARPLLPPPELPPLKPVKKPPLKKPKPKPAPAAPAAPKLKLIFPVVGAVRYTDDFGAPRAGGTHQGNDLMAAKRSPAVAAEAGKVKFWTTSAAAGCMLYLYGASGTTYLYIHLNNDLTKGNDNRGKCVAGTSYAKGLADGAKVRAGQPIGYVGDSGDANGIASHLHFEVHPKDGRAVDPFPFLQKARHLLFAADPRVPLTLNLSGTVASVAPGKLILKIAALRASNGFRLSKIGRTIALAVPDTAVVETPAVALTRTVSTALVGQTVQIVTPPKRPTLAAELGTAGALSVAKVVVSAPAGPPIG